MWEDIEFATITKSCKIREIRETGQEEATHCFRVFERRVGILSAVVFSTRPVRGLGVEGGKGRGYYGSDVEIHARAG